MKVNILKRNRFIKNNENSIIKESGMALFNTAYACIDYYKLQMVKMRITEGKI